MHPAAPHPTRSLPLLAGALLLLLSSVTVGHAQVSGLNLASSRTLRLLEQADVLIEQSQWDDAFDTLDLIQVENADKLFRAPSGRYFPLSEACQARYCGLPEGPLSDLRARIDPTAAALLEQARQTGSAMPLTRIVREYFASSHTPSAMLLMADLGIERGDFNAARRALERVHPLLTDPAGKPIGVALGGIDLDKHWEALHTRLTAARPTIPAIHPDGRPHLAEALVRLVYCSAAERDHRRAALELKVFEHAAPTDVGLVGGQRQVLCDAARRLVESSTQWPQWPPQPATAMLGGTPERAGAAAAVGELRGPEWSRPVSLTPPPPPQVAARQGMRIIVNGRVIVSPTTETEPPRPPRPTAIPVTWRDFVLLRDRNQIRAYRLENGAPGVTPDGVLHAAAATPANLNRNAMRIQQLRVLGAMRFAAPAAAANPEAEPVVVEDDVLYAHVPPEDARRRRATPGGDGTQIIGLSLNREGLETANLKSPPEPWRFSGPPLVEEGLAYVALAASEVRPRVAVGCFDVVTGESLWLTPICSGRPDAEDSAERPADALSKSGDRVYFNTNLGGVAALDANDGRLCWLTPYPQTAAATTFSPDTDTPSPTPCVCHRGLVLVAPQDSPTLFGLNAATGAVLWAIPRGTGDVQLLGAVDATLVAGGDLLTAVDTATGATHYQWPASPRSGVKGMGRGCLAGSEVFWPTRNRIYAFNIQSGAMTRSPIELGELGGAGANLTPAYGRLVVASAKQLTVLGPSLPAHNTDAPAPTDQPAPAADGPQADASGEDISSVLTF